MNDHEALKSNKMRMVAVLKKYMVKQQNKTSLVKSIVEEEESSTSSGLESYNKSLNNSLSSSEESGVDLGKSVDSFSKSDVWHGNHI